MSVKVENLEKNMAKLTIEVGADEFEKAMDSAFKKNKSRINVQGFRKGKAPRKIVEKLYGPEIFYEDAANELIPDAYDSAAEESGLKIVSQPEIDITQIGKGKELIFTASVALKPEVTLGEYKGLEVEKKSAEISEEEVSAELDRIREQNARTITVEEGAAKEGDTVVIDYEGFMDGETFEGGKGDDMDLVLGSGTFIDTFEEQLVGKTVNEEVEVHVTFPEEYQAAELAGRPAVFQVKVKEIKHKELPELDDEFAQDVSDFDTLEEYKADIEKNLKERKEQQVKNEKEEAVVDKAVDNAQMEIPEPMLDTQVRQMANDFARRIQSQGLTLEQYFQFTGMDAKKMLEQMRPQAERQIRSRLVLEAIVEAENIVASEEDIENEIANMAAAYRMEVDKVKEMIGEKEKEQLKLDMAVKKAVEFLVASAVEK